MDSWHSYTTTDGTLTLSVPSIQTAMERMNAAAERVRAAFRQRDNTWCATTFRSAYAFANTPVPFAQVTSTQEPRMSSQLLDEVHAEKLRYWWNCDTTAAAIEITQKTYGVPGPGIESRINNHILRDTIKWALRQGNAEARGSHPETLEQWKIEQAAQTAARQTLETIRIQRENQYYHYDYPRMQTHAMCRQPMYDADTDLDTLHQFLDDCTKQVDTIQQRVNTDSYDAPGDGEMLVENLVSTLASAITQMFHELRHTVSMCPDKRAAYNRVSMLMLEVFQHSIWTNMIAKMQDDQEILDSTASSVINALIQMWDAPLMLRDMLLNKNEWANVNTKDKYGKHAIERMYEKWRDDTRYVSDTDTLKPWPCEEFRSYMRKYFIAPATCEMIRKGAQPCADGKRWMRETLEEGTYYDVFDCYDADRNFPHASFIMPYLSVFAPLEHVDTMKNIFGVGERCESCNQYNCDGCEYCDGCEEYIPDGEYCNCSTCPGCDTRIPDGDSCDDCSYCEDCDTTYSGDECNCERCSHCERKIESYNDDTCECSYCNNCNTTYDPENEDCECSYCAVCDEKFADDRCDCEHCDICNLIVDDPEDGREVCECVPLVLPVCAEVLPNTQAMEHLYDGGALILNPHLRFTEIDGRGSKKWTFMDAMYVGGE